MNNIIVPKSGFCLKVRDVCKDYVSEDGSVKHVLWNVNLSVKAGQIISVVGPSGCGKSTLLKAILGTNPPTSGTITADNELVIRPSSRVGIVYQDYALYPFMTARENVAFGLMLAQTSIPSRLFRPFSWNKLRKQHLQQADEMLGKVGLSESCHAFPSELSGGMRQRVAVAQALIMKPSILLMDEPFGALDEATRESLQLMLLQLYQENIKAKKAGQRPPYTILIVTHELNEALYVADRVIGLSQYHPDGDKGATILYDEAAPVFRPDEPKDVTSFAAQREEIRRIVFSPDNRKNAEKLIRIWHESPAEFLPGDEKLSEDRI